MIKIVRYWARFDEEEARRRSLALRIASFDIANIRSVLAARGLHPTEQQRLLLAGCTDTATLRRWFKRSITADSADEVFQDEKPNATAAA